MRPRAEARNLESSGAAPLRAPAARYVIGELARLAEVSTRTIRYYEETGLLDTARRFSGGRRAFNSDALERLRFIGRLKRLGLSLEEIRHLNEVFAESSTRVMRGELDLLLGRHLNTIDERLRELRALRGEITAYRRRIRARAEAG